MNESHPTQESLSVTTQILPVLAIRDNVLFPHVVFPMVVTEKQSVRLIHDALAGTKTVAVFTVKNPEAETPGKDDLYATGTMVSILKMFQVPDGTIRLLVQGVARIRLKTIEQETPYLTGVVEEIAVTYDMDMELEAMMRAASDNFQKMVTLSPILPDELKVIINNIREPDRLADMIASSLNIDPPEKQKILESLNVHERLGKVINAINHEIQLLELNNKIQTEVNAELSKTQREYFLREQLKAIRHELGEDEDETIEVDELSKKIAAKKMPAEARKAAEKELERLSQMSPSSAEYTVSKTYIDWLLELPWQNKTRDSIQIKKAKTILDADHYDLDDVKDRILEFLAVRKLRKESKSPILCFLGPPGVGKTSLGKSIARAVGRKFVRFSLGGVKDEAEIRGHRRTYIGALPGKIIQELRRCQSNNPVFMLDEIDKIGQDFRGDPASALLEVLDPEQNVAFHDHYIDIPFNLSNVMFIATANELSPIPPALLDRMEVLRLPGYITEEKLEIAKRYIIPRQIIENGLRKQDLEISDQAVIHIISAYTWESGVRNLEREISNVCRKVARKIAEGAKSHYQVTENNLHEYLGPQKVFPETAHRSDEIGIATGLAWTQNGGEILFIESRIMPGNRGLQLTGQLGNVMKESAQAALSFIRSRAKELNINRSFFDNMDIHIHIPSGSTPKDGPSAGITIAICLASLLTRQPVRADIAMTGEITLRGKVMPVGGIREKVVAARRAGIKTIIMPRLNENDLENVPDYIKRSLTFHFVDHIDDALPLALIRKNNVKTGNGKQKKNTPAVKSVPGALLKKQNRRAPAVTQKPHR